MARRTFFSFHYTPDVWRAMNVRKSWEFLPGRQDADGFFDASVFEASQRESEESLKRFLREGLKNSSVTCVLAGTMTSERKWVRYEIAQSVLKGNGLVAVDIHNVKNKDGHTSNRGDDPLAKMGLYKADGAVFLAELQGTKWVKYQDYSLAIPTSVLWFPPPTSNTVVKLSDHCMRYDFIRDDGRSSIGDWLEEAASLAGR
ncbi:MAG: hypothetical protein EON54_23325 [Alcaligenaceae bacterium]|nr:MAG: hypothetical protein EON54_23325 [Alcaligenaceae bacterium]